MIHMDGRKEEFFGSDRFEVIAHILGKRNTSHSREAIIVTIGDIKT